MQRRLASFEGLYDCIVVGLGGMGSSALANLSNRSSCQVLGIEKYGSVHTNGSSHGRSRVFRRAYFEHPSYVPLMQRSIEMWRDLQARNTDKEIINFTGGLMLGNPESQVIQGVMRSIEEHNLPHELLDADQIRTRFSGLFVVDDDDIGVFEEEAGYLIPENCIHAYLKEAGNNGADMRFDEEMISYKVDPSAEIITVHTSKGSVYRTKRLILSVGPWAPDVFGHDVPHLQLHVERRILYWFEPVEESNHLFDNLPIYIYQKGEDNFYGFPRIGRNEGVKVAQHSAAGQPSCKPESVDRSVSTKEIHEMKTLLDAHIPALNGKLMSTTTCMYTMTSDQHFLIDKHPEHDNVVLISPCSGHGFKFCSVIGEIAAELAMTGKYDELDISIFRYSSVGRNGN